MEKRKENKLRMFKAVWQVLLKFKTIWVSNAGIAEVTTEFENNLKKIEDIRKTAETGSKGVTMDKTILRDNLIDSVMELSGPFTALASRMQDNELLKKVSYSDSQLDDMTEAGLAQTGKDLAKLALQKQEGLLKYGVTPEEINNLQQISENYSSKIALQRGSITTRSTALEQQDQLFRQTSLLLKNQLDGLIDKFRRTSTEFHTEYFKARKIVDYGIRYEVKDEKVVNGTEVKGK